MSIKRLRHNAIVELVKAGRVESQEGLARELHQMGMNVSQSTLSRDIRELGLAKSGDVYTLAPTPARRGSPTLRRILDEFLLQVDGVHQTLVLKTGPGNAATVAQALDDAEWPEIVGTIAGEDTIFMLCRSKGDVRRLQERIRKLLA